MKRFITRHPGMLSLLVFAGIAFLGLCFLLIVAPGFDAPMFIVVAVGLPMICLWIALPAAILAYAEAWMVIALERQRLRGQIRGGVLEPDAANDPSPPTS